MALKERDLRFVGGQLLKKGNVVFPRIDHESIAVVLHHSEDKKSTFDSRVTPDTLIPYIRGLSLLLCVEQLESLAKCAVIYLVLTVLRVALHLLVPLNRILSHLALNS